jgi:hypothetical protein
MTQFETQANDLLGMKRCDRLNSCALMIDVANDSTIRVIEDDVGQGAKIMPVMGTRLPRRDYKCFHTRRRRINVKWSRIAKSYSLPKKPPQ